MLEGAVYNIVLIVLSFFKTFRDSEWLMKLKGGIPFLHLGAMNKLCQKRTLFSCLL